MADDRKQKTEHGELGIEYHAVVETHRIGLPTVHLQTDFSRQFSYGDNIEVEVSALFRLPAP